MCNNDDDVILRAVKTFGDQAQKIIALEEMAELQQALTKDLRGHPVFENICEEMADVEIVLDELGKIYNNRDKVDEWKAKKLQRLTHRINEFVKN